MHRNTTYFDPLFEIIESSYFVTDIPIHQFLSANFEPTAATRRVKVDLNTRSKYCKSLLTVDSNGDTQEIEKLLLPENHFELADVTASSQSLRDILTVDAKELTLGLRYSLMCAVRMRRLVQTAQGRRSLLRLQYQATAILLGCHPDSSVLFSFFQDKVDLIKNFMYLLRTGPGSLDYKPDVVDLDIRLLACQCLEAIVGSRDQSSTPIFARYPWMMFDLGLNRGQYMGLLPCLIRSSTSYLISLDATEAEQASLESAAVVESKMDVESSAHVGANSHLSDPEVEARLLWIENVFMLLIAIVNVSTALPALTDNGLIGSILLVMERLNIRNRSTTLIFVEIMTIEILESSVTSHSPAMLSFKEKNGMEVIINRLCRELQLYFTDGPSAPLAQAEAATGAYTKGTYTSIPVASSILIQEFFSLLTSVLQEGRNDSADRNGQWYKLPALAQSFHLIFTNAKALGSLVLSPAVSLLAEIINSDPSPPSIFSYMLSSGIAKEAMCVMVGRNPADVVDTDFPEVAAGAAATLEPSTPEVAFSSDSMLSLLCLMSSLSITKDGIALVTAVAPFPAIFNMFFDPQYVFPTSRILMQELPNMAGTNLEELLRHYPAYCAPCLAALTHAMQVITERADKYVGQANYADQSGDINFTDYFIQTLHFSTGILLCLEPLLLRPQNIVELHRLGGLKYMTTFLKIALGPPRYILESFACMIDSTLNSLGYSPLLALVISRICNQIAEHEQKRMFECLLEDLQVTVEALEIDLLDYATRYGPSEVTRFIAREASSVNLVPPTAGGNGNPLIEGLLDTVTRDPIQDCTDSEGPLSEKLLAFARVMRGFSLLDCLAEAIGTTLTQRGKIAQTKDCIAQLTATAGRDLLSEILNKLYLPTQLEMARARGMFVNSNKDSCVKVHPVYHLLVVAAEHVVVKDSLEDTATKVCKLGRGCTVLAYERRTAGPGNNMLKYRTKDGWINVFRNASSSDPLVLVTHVSKKSPEEYAEEVARNGDIFADADKRSDFEKFASVSCKRGGFLAFYHFNHSVKSHLLSVLSRHVFSREVTPSGMQESISVSPHAVSLVQMLLGCVTALIPELPNPTPRSDFDLDALFNGNKSPAAAGASRSRKGKSPMSDKLSAADSGSMPSVAVTSAILKEKYFQNDPVPLLDQFPTSMLYATIRLVEMSHMLFFDARRGAGKNELNPLLMAHLVYNKEYLERIFHASSILFLCALPDVALETADLPEHRHLYKGKWYPLLESELDQDRDEAEVAEDDTAAAEADTAASAAAMDVVDSTPSDGKAKGKAAKTAKGKGKVKGKDTKEEEPTLATASAAVAAAPKPAFVRFPTYLAYRRALRERRLLAVSSIDNVANLYKLLCTAVANGQNSPGQLNLTSTEKVLQRDANDEHDFDPYAMRRYILNTLTKYLSQIWSHPQLHHLPPYTTKNILDMLAVVIKSLHDLKTASGIRAPLPAAHSSSAGSASNPMEALLRSSRLGGAARLGATAGRGAQLAADMHNLRALARVAPAPAISEESIRALEDMGFSRRAILRASRELHSSDANQLVSYLLENPYLDEPEPAAAPAPVPASTAVAASSSSAATSSASAPPAEAAAAAASAPAGSASNVAAATDEPDSTTGAPPVFDFGVIEIPPLQFDNANFFGNMDNLLMAASPRDSPLALHSVSSTGAVDGRAAKEGEDKQKEKSKEARVNPLPLIAKQSDTALRQEQDLVQRILKCIYRDVHPLCLRLIEQGPSKLLSLLDLDIKTANAGVTREIFTVLVLNNMVNCMDKNPLPHVLLRIVQLKWLFNRAIDLCGQENLTAAHFSSLYGVLHGILVLLTSKVRTSSSTPHITSGNELLLLIFTVDDRFNKLYSLMIAALEKYATELQSAERIAIDNAAASAESTNWIAPAILILDIVTQPILVDIRSLSSHVSTLDKFINMNPTSTLTDSASDLTAEADDSPLSEQVRTVINKAFLRKTATSSALHDFDEMFDYIDGGAARKAGRSFDGSFGFDWDPPSEDSAGSSGAGSSKPARRGRRSKAAAAKSPQPAATEEKKSRAEDADATSVAEAPALPLYESAVSVELRQRCLSIGLNLLNLSSKGKMPSSSIPQATMQLVAHLTRNPDARNEFHKQQGGILILRCPSAFDGMPSVVFTLLQQVLEDEKFLTQSMVTAIRLCLLRLSKQKSQPVLLKNFIEVICPVVFREQALFMKLLKSHTQIKSVSGEKFISLREGAPVVSEPKASTGDSSASTALVLAGSSAAPAGVEQDKPDASAAAAPATKRQRLQDGTAQATSSALNSSTKAPAAGTSSATASGIKSGAKRVLNSDSASAATPSVTMTTSAAKQSASVAALAALGNETVNEVVDELFSRIVCKWLSIKSMDAEGNTKLAAYPGAVDTSLTISEMLIIAADLIASLPSFAICVHRYCFNVAKVPDWAAETAKAHLPLKHALTGQSVGGLFTTFVIHALLLPAKILQPACQTDPPVSAELAAKNRTAQTAAVEKLTGSTLRDACAYFLASLASRPGDGRKRVLNEILNSANVGTVVINRTEQLRCLVAFAEVLQYLICPPARWASRDAFILPSKDILVHLAKLNAHTRIAAAICAIDLTHPLALEASIVLSVPLETIIKKGLDAPPAPAADAANTPKVAAALTITAGGSAADGASATRETAHDSAVGSASASAPSALTSAEGALGPSSSSASTTTPSVRRTTFAPSTLPSSAPAPASQATGTSAQSFVTPAMNRRRGNTDQSLDAEERLLLLTGSEMHSNSDQHGHLMRPTGAVADSDGSDAGFDEEGEEGDGADGGVREVTLGHNDEGDSEDDGDVST